MINIISILLISIEAIAKFDSINKSFVEISLCQGTPTSELNPGQTRPLLCPVFIFFARCSDNAKRIGFGDKVRKPHLFTVMNSAQHIF